MRWVGEMTDSKTRLSRSDPAGRGPVLSLSPYACETFVSCAPVYLGALTQLMSAAHSAPASTWTMPDTAEMPLFDLQHATLVIAILTCVSIFIFFAAVFSLHCRHRCMHQAEEVGMREAFISRYSLAVVNSMRKQTDGSISDMEELHIVSPARLSPRVQIDATAPFSYMIAAKYLAV